MIKSLACCHGLTSAFFTPMLSRLYELRNNSKNALLSLSHLGLVKESSTTRCNYNFGRVLRKLSVISNLLTYICKSFC